MHHDFLAALSGTVDPRAIVIEPDLIAPWLVDWRGRYQGASSVMLQPGTVAEVQAIVQTAARCRVALVPQGGNTSMVGGATPPGDGSAVILSLRRMNRIRGLDEDGGRAVVEAGVILSDLHAAAARIGRRFPLTLGSRGSATIGGLVSTNAGGTQVLRFGTMRRLVLGLEAVLADGTRHDHLAALAKDNRGPAIDQLLIGAEGTFGIVTAAALSLVPAATRATAWLGVDAPSTALRLLRSLEAGGLAVESFEIIPDETLRTTLRYLPGATPPLAASHPWHALVEVADCDPDRAAAALEAALAAALSNGLVEDAALATSDVQAERMWALRDSLSAAERAAGPASQHDISVPVAAMPAFMMEAAAACEQRFPGSRASGFGHLGDGNIHFHVRAPCGVEAAAWYAIEAPAITAFVHDLVTSAGGSIAAEHGIGQMKRDELARVAPDRAGVLRALKAALDPLGILNPGKLVTLAPRGPAP